MIWIVLGCCWVSQIRTKPTKNIWGPLLDSISSYYVQCPWKIVSFFQVFRHLNYHILVFFPAYIGLYWTPAGWYGQKPYLGPAHMWLWQNMAVCDAELGPKWGGVTNIHFKNFMSYRSSTASDVYSFGKMVIQLIESWVCVYSLIFEHLTAN